MVIQMILPSREECAFEEDPKKRGRPTSRDGGKTPESRQSQTLAPSSRTKTGTGPSGKEEGLPCFDYKQGHCKDDKRDFWHPAPYVDHRSGKCRDGQSCLFVHGPKTDREAEAHQKRFHRQLDDVRIIQETARSCKLVVRI